MSKVREHKAFLYLVKVTHRDQAYALLKSLSHEQTDAIGELFENVLQSVIHLTPETLDLFRRNRGLVRHLASSSVKPSTRQSIIQRRYRTVYELVRSVHYGAEDYLDSA